MSTCDRREAVRYLWLAAACVVFAVVYQAFGHGVTSLAMSAMFVWPLALGALPSLLISRLRDVRLGWRVRFLRGAGIATLIAGGAVTGIIEIYGTTSALTPVYWCVGGLLTLAGGIGGLIAKGER